MRWREYLKKQEKERERNRKIFIEGMKLYQEQGISVLIDGKVADESSWGKLFEINEDGKFYMADYIFEEPSAYGLKQNDKEVGEGEPIVCESMGFYGMGQRLKEIRFDLVYNK